MGGKKTGEGEDLEGKHLEPYESLKDDLKCWPSILEVIYLSGISMLNFDHAFTFSHFFSALWISFRFISSLLYFVLALGKVVN